MAGALLAVCLSSLVWTSVTCAIVRVSDDDERRLATWATVARPGLVAPGALPCGAWTSRISWLGLRPPWRAAPPA